MRQGNSTPLSFIQDEKKKMMLLLLQIYEYSFKAYTLLSYA